MNREFRSLGQFAAFIARSRPIEFAADTAARGAAAAFITEKVRDRIGKPELLPPPLAESTVAERERKGFSPDETLLRTGELQESIAWDHEHPLIARHTIVGSTDKVALYHEFGGEAGRPPQRSFLAATMAEHDNEAFGIYFGTFVEVFRPI